jgi:hypothetical protein
LETSSNKLYDITTDRITVWVNGPHGLLGRFGRMGIDIHRPLLDTRSLDEHCLFCAHEETTEKDWNLFVTKMAEHFQIDVPAKFKPRFPKSKKKPQRC